MLTVALLVLALWIAPQLYLVKFAPIPLFLVAGVAAFFVRRSPVDAALLTLALIATVGLGEPWVGPHALAVLCLGPLALSGRPRFSMLTGGALFAIFLVSVELKERFAGSTLTWQDVHYFFLQFSDNVGVLASQPTLLIYAAGAGIATIGAALASWRLEGPLNEKQRSENLKPHYLARGLAAVLALWSGWELEAASRIESQNNRWHFAADVTYTPVATFLSTLHIQPDAVYRKLDTARFSRDVRALSLATAAFRAPADIVLFLQESQFNPMAIRGCGPKLCQSDLFEAREETTDYGELRVHIHGGGTWLSEFALLMGLPHTVFGRAGEFAPFNIAPGAARSFVRSLKSAGYYTIAVYPVSGGMMNARKAYGAYGFDEFLDSSDLGLTGTYDTHDGAIHAAAVKALHAAQRHGKPVFLMAVTIFNHSEHGVSMERVPESIKNEAGTVMDSATEKDNLADYVWRTRDLEAAYTSTRAAILGASRPAVLAWFGDHQPAFGKAPGLRDRIKASTTAPTVPDRYVTWYDIASNTGPPPAGEKRHRMDVVFLPGMLAQRAGVPLDDWLAASVLARERCAGLLVECTDPAARDTYISYLLGDLHAIR